MLERGCPRNIAYYSCSTVPSTIQYHAGRTNISISTTVNWQKADYDAAVRSTMDVSFGLESPTYSGIQHMRRLWSKANPQPKRALMIILTDGGNNDPEHWNHGSAFVEWGILLDVSPLWFLGHFVQKFSVSVPLRSLSCNPGSKAQIFSLEKCTEEKKRNIVDLPLEYPLF